MRIICIYNKINNYRFDLVVGKEYEVCDIEDDKFYNIKNKGCYPKYLFISKEEYRNQKLEKLGI